MLDIPLKDILLHIVEAVSFAIGIIGVSVIIWGVFKSMVRFILVEGHIWDNELANKHREKIRNDLGYYLLLGMEFLVAADVIHTILNPSLEELAILGAIVLIRVVLSFFLQRELDKHLD